MNFNTGHVYRTDHKITSLIHISTKNSSLVLAAGEELFQLYYGTAISSPEEIAENGTFLPAQELAPIYDGFAGSNTNPTLLLTHADHSTVTDLEYLEHSQTQHEDGSSLTIITLKEKQQPFYVKLHYRAHFQEDTIESWSSIEHGEEGEVTLHQYPSSQFSFANIETDYYLRSFQGLWERENSVQDEKLTIGKKVFENRYGTWSSFGLNPSFMLSIGEQASETHGHVLAGALAWSGAWEISFDLNFGKLTYDRFERRHLDIRAGVNSFSSDYKLAPKEVFTTPKLITTFSSQGHGQASRNLHRWGRNHGLRDGDKSRPVLLNSWEGAYFTFDEDKLLSMMDGLAEMGGEMFVLDDGWFGNGENARNAANAGLGDWQVNKEKLPRGLSFLADEAESRGLKFGLWVEPEMVNPKSELFEKHPDWIFQQPGRDVMVYRAQALLDLSNPEVENFVYQSVADLLKENPKISYIKWDCNRSFANIGSTYLAKDKQTHIWKDYVDALYRVYDRLAKEFPETIFQACASGGGRIEYGILSYNHEFWASDNTDALQRIFMQWGIGHIYPAIACASHVSICPNHQTGRSLPLKFRFDVAMSARLGLELNPKDLTADELAFVKNAVEEYKKVRRIVFQGDQYRLVSPYHNHCCSLMYVSEDKSEALLFVYKISHLLGQMAPQIKLQGLDSDASYALKEINAKREKPICTQDGKTLSGDSLMNHGLKMRLLEEYDSAVFKLEKQK